MRYFSKTNDAAVLPTRATNGSAGYDFTVTDAHWIRPCETVIFHTGIKVHMNPDEVLLMFIRSSIGIRSGIAMVTGTSVIDSDYHDEILIPLRSWNLPDGAMRIEAGSRIAQGVFVKYLTTDNDSATEERKGGIGSTGE